MTNPRLYIVVAVVFLLAVVVPLGQYIHSFSSSATSSASLAIQRWYSSSSSYVISPSAELTQTLVRIDEMNAEINRLSLAANDTVRAFVEAEMRVRWVYSLSRSSMSIDNARAFLLEGKTRSWDREGTADRGTFFNYADLRAHDDVYRYLRALREIALRLSGADTPFAPLLSSTQGPRGLQGSSGSTNNNNNNNDENRLVPPQLSSASVLAPESSPFALRRGRNKPAQSFPEINLSLLQTLTDLLYQGLRDPLALYGESPSALRLLEHVPAHLQEEVFPEMTAKQVQSQLDFMWKWIKQSRAREHPVITAALMHCNFLDLHPFVTGNQRAAMILLNLILIKHGLPLHITRKTLYGHYKLKWEIAKERNNFLPMVEFVAQEMLQTLIFLQHLHQGIVDPQ